MSPQELEDKNLVFIRDVKTKAGNYYRIYRNKVSGALVYQCCNEDADKELHYVYPDVFPLLLPIMLDDILKEK